MLNADIHDESVGKVQGPAPISRGEEQQEDSPKVDSGLSSIEKSKSVRAEVIPPMNIPILVAPADQQSVVFAVASVDAQGLPVINAIRSVILKGEEIKDGVLEGWMKNLREIQEQVRQLLNSPIYQKLQEIRQKGDSQAGKVSGVQSVTSTSSAAQAEPVEFLSALDRLQVMERVPSTAEVQGATPSQDSTAVLVLPLTAALLAGGLVIGTELMNITTHPLGGVFELVERLKPLFPTVSVSDIIPLINLMAVGPIYYHSWNEAVNNLANRERRHYIQTAQNFAKDVIKIVTDPNFIKSTLINRMKGTDQLSPQDQERLARMLKVVLIGVSLSLLYSVEVGKVQKGQFGGIEPEELRDLLLGKLTPPLDPSIKPTLQDELTASLIRRASEQLAPLSIEDRTQAANMLLDYITKTQDFDPMLDPAKVFDETLTASTFNPKDKTGMIKG